MFEIKETYFPHMSEIIKNYLVMNWYHKTFTTLNQEYDIHPDVYVSDNDEPNFPLVILIGGVGGSGKSTFIQYCKNHMDGVFEESTIDCCKQVVNYMAHMESICKKGSLLQSEINIKSDQYRTLLNRLKSAWCEIDDGPNELVIHRVRNLMSSDENPSVIFINVREPEQIDHLKAKLEDEASCVVLTLAVTRNESDMFTNQADRTTLDYDYDMYVNNTSDLETLEEVAVQFCIAVRTTNREIQKLYMSMISRSTE